MNFSLFVFSSADPVEEKNDSSAQTATNSAAELLKQGAGTKDLCLICLCVKIKVIHQCIAVYFSKSLLIQKIPSRIFWF